jgi:hypothetical protein
MAVCSQPQVIQVRQPFSVLSQNMSLWPRFLTFSIEFPLPSRAILSERILPLPKITCQALIDHFCPADQQEAVSNNDANRDCLARVYLGRRSDSKPSANFTLRNFNLHLDQMLSVDAPVFKYAKMIAEALAVIHWQANVDGFDIEFDLGSEPPLRKMSPRLCCLSDPSIPRTSGYARPSTILISTSINELFACGSWTSTCAAAGTRRQVGRTPKP